MNLRILIIEDDPENREGLRILISRHSPRSQVFLAGSVEEAYDLLRQNAIDIMFLDIQSAYDRYLVTYDAYAEMMK